MKQVVKIGTKIKAKRTIYYLMGQIPSDKISRGEICTVDEIYKDGRVSVKEHADRYGPWSLDCFDVILNYKIDKVDIRVETEFDRDGEPKKNFDKIYIWTTGHETVLEYLMNRHNHPYREYKNKVIPQLMEKLKKRNSRAYNGLKNVKWGWNKNCGCSMCSCSPGFVGNVHRGVSKEVYTIHVHVTITN